MESVVPALHILTFAQNKTTAAHTRFVLCKFTNNYCCKMGSMIKTLRESQAPNKGTYNTLQKRTLALKSTLQNKKQKMQIIFYYTELNFEHLFSMHKTLDSISSTVQPMMSFPVIALRKWKGGGSEVQGQP